MILNQSFFFSDWKPQVWQHQFLLLKTTIWSEIASSHQHQGPHYSRQGIFFFNVSELPKTMQEVYVQVQPRHQNNAGLCHPWSDAQTPVWLCPQTPQAGGGKVPERCLSTAEHGCLWDAAPHIHHVGRAIPSEQKHLEIKERSNIVGPPMPVPQLSQKEVG